jgi:hypothetical protein
MTRPAGALRSVLTKRSGRYRGSVGERRSVLVNFVYCHPVGHAIEALHYCHGYHRADPGLRIGLALNADTPTELAALCPYIDDIYPISVDVFDPGYDSASAPDAIPAGWDWVVSDVRGQQPHQRAAFPGLARYYDQARDRFATSGSVLATAGGAPPSYSPGCQFRLRLPGAARSKAAQAALAVGTPWLSIAGNRWPEYYFNGVPFYSVLPDLKRFPAYNAFGPDPLPVDDDGPRAPSMCYERIRNDLAEIVEGAARLIERRWPFETAMSDHFARIWALREGRADLIWSIDSAHKPYLPAKA